MRTASSPRSSRDSTSSTTPWEYRTVARQLEDRAALITGASQGLGKEIAAAYLREGASIAICARDARMLETVRAELAPLATGGQKILARPCDVSKRDQVEALVEHAVATFPELDILVNS